MATHRYTVTHNVLRTPSVRSVTLAPETGVRPLLFEPGQYVAVSLHDRLRPTTTRCFSVASSPNNRSHLEIAVRVGGAYTNALERLTPGDRVVLRGPYGSFVLKEHLYPHLVFFAGGIGITPFMSMIRYATELRLSNTIHLIYSCRHQDDIPFLKDILAHRAHNPNFRVTFVIGEGSTARLSGYEVMPGRVDASSFTTLGLGKENETYMMCGPGGYLASMEKLLKSNGVPHEHIMTESFSQGQGGESAEARWPRNMYALSGLSLVVAGLCVVSSDILATLPTLEADYESVIAESARADTRGERGNTLAYIETIPPLVDTTYTQDPIVTHVPNPEVKIVTIASDTPTPSPLPPPPPQPAVTVPTTPKQTVVTSAPAPKPTPTPTVKTKTKPKTKVS